MKLDPLCCFSPEAIWTEGKRERERLRERANETKKMRKPEI